MGVLPVRVHRGVIVLLLVVFATFVPTIMVESVPNIPTMGGVIVQTNVTGVALGIATYSNNDFVIVGTAGNVSSNATAWHVQPGDALAARYSSNAVNRWVRSWDLGNDDDFMEVIVDGDGNTYAIGYTRKFGGIDGCGGTIETTPHFTGWAYVMKITNDGDEVWRTNFSFSGRDGTFFQGGVLDGNHLILVGGTHLDTLNPLGCATSRTVQPFIVKMDLSGTVVDSKRFTQYSCSHWIKVASGASGNYYTVGQGFETDDCLPEEGDPPTSGCTSSVNLTAVIWNYCDNSQAFIFTDVATITGKVVSEGTIWDGQMSASTLARNTGTQAVAWHKVETPALANSFFHGMSIVTDSSDASYVTFLNRTHGISVPPFEFPFHKTLNPGGVLKTYQTHNVKYTASGTTVWSVIYGEEGVRNYVPYGSALDGEPRLLIAGARTDRLTGATHPLILRYQDLE